MDKGAGPSDNNVRGREICAKADCSCEVTGFCNSQCALICQINVLELDRDTPTAFQPPPLWFRRLNVAMTYTCTPLNTKEQIQKSVYHVGKVMT